MKNQLSSALDDLSGGGGGGSGGGGDATVNTKRSRARVADKVRKNNKHALDAKRASKQAVRARQRAMRAAGGVAKEPLTEARRAAVKRRNVGYYAMTGAAVDAHGEAAAKALGVGQSSAGANGGGGDDGDEEEMLW